IFLVYDGTKSIADQTVYISSVESTWSNVDQNSLASLQREVERRVGPQIWQGLVKPYFLDQPVSLVLAVLGAILILLGRKKKPLIGTAGDGKTGDGGIGAAAPFHAPDGDFLTVPAPASPPPRPGHRWRRCNRLRR